MPELVEATAWVIPDDYDVAVFSQVARFTYELSFKRLWNYPEFENVLTTAMKTLPTGSVGPLSIGAAPDTHNFPLGNSADRRATLLAAHEASSRDYR